MAARRRLSNSQIVALVEGAEKISSVTGEKPSEIVAWVLGEVPDGGEDGEEAAEAIALEAIALEASGAE
jgi:hypothetical protein